MASWLGPVASVVSGGVGCVLATAWVAATTPALRAYRLTAKPEIPAEDDRTEGRAGEPS